MRVSTNVHAMVARRHMGNAHNDSAKESQGLSSGDRITHAAYDPSGLAISEKMRAQSRSMGQSLRNINDGISLFQVGEGTLNTIQNLSGRLRELTLQSMNDTINDDQRTMADLEFQQIKTEINKLTQSTKFNGNHLLNGKGSNYEIQVGTHGDKDVDRIQYNMKRALDSAENFNMGSVGIGSKESARRALAKIDSMSEKISHGRAELGSVMSRFQHMSANMEVSRENVESSKSRIRDTDIAQATASRTISNIKLDASTNMLAQMNSNPKSVARLIG